MNPRLRAVALCALLAGIAGAGSGQPGKPALPSFQALVDATPAGGTLVPPPGAYAGPVRVDKPIVIDGAGKVTIDGGGKGTVFELLANSSTLRGLHLTASGGSHDSDDACLNVRGQSNLIENLEIDDCLFGIDLKQSDRNVLRGNRIRSKPAELGLRGDGIRLWYSNGNRVEGNTVTDSRDMVVWYSSDNVFTGNYGARSRYSIHFMFANRNVIENNRFYDNSVGIYLMYNDDTVVRNNVISHATGPTGMGVGFKEASNAVIEGNEFIYCASGTYSDLSPFQPDSRIRFRNNRFAYNGIAMYFVSNLPGNVIEGNVFEGNLSHVAVSGGGSVIDSEWRGNYWEDYEGFDRDRNGVGDRPYELHAYADSIWMEIPQARFFRNAPMLEVVDFLERLAPFSNPTLILRDAQPLMTKPARSRT
jgi:nitrous oxidase accessory protein